MTMNGKLAYSIGFFCLIIGITTTSEPERIGKLIIDTDAGGDDAVAILLALAAEKQVNGEGLQVIGITCTYGNTNVTNVGTNVLKLLTIANREDIPVYLGAERPLLKNFTQGNYFGEDGFGDFEFDKAILGHVDRSKHASTAMVEFARQYPGEVSVMAIGPTTNVALAMTLDPNFGKNVNKFYLLGSSVRGIGNIGPNVEFNFSQDPPSNFIVMNWVRGEPIDLFPWETALNAAITTEWRTNVLGSVDSSTVKYLNKIERMTFQYPSWTAADAMLSALILWPALIKETTIVNVNPVYDGAGAGSVLVDYANTTGRALNTRILDSFDVEAFKNLLLQIFALN